VPVEVGTNQRSGIDRSAPVVLETPLSLISPIGRGTGVYNSECCKPDNIDCINIGVFFLSVGASFST
jgi:hypothetical protein